MNRTEELFDMYLQGSMTRAEADELTQILKTDREAGRLLAAHIAEVGRIVRGCRTLEKSVVRGEAGSAAGTGFRRQLLLWGSVAAAAAALVIGVGTWWIGGKEAGGGAGLQVVEARDCRVGDAVTAVRPDAVVAAGDTISTGPGGYARLAMKDGTTIEVNGMSSLKLAGYGAGAVDLTVTGGDIYVSAKCALRINAGQYDQVVNAGTVFEFARRTEGGSSVKVASGKVRMGFGSVVEVGALQASEVQPGGFPSQPTALDLAGIAPWSRTATAAASPGTIYKGNFAAKALGSFWAPVATPDNIRVGNGFLSVTVGPARPGGTEPASTEMASQPICLSGRPVEIALSRNPADNLQRNMFLPLDGEPTVRIEVAGRGKGVICRLAWRSYVFRPAIEDKPAMILTGLYADIGDRKVGNIAKSDTPVTARIVVCPDGQVFLGSEQSPYALAIGRCEAPVESVTLKLCLTNKGDREITMRWRDIVVKRLASVPAWAKPVPSEK